MKPISFSCHKIISASPQSISANIANTDKWKEFEGYAILPKIKEATYEKRTDQMVGSRIRVINSDGSTHVEEIFKWEPGRAISMKLAEFSAPLNGIASHFIEEWTFEPTENGTSVTRSFQLFAARWYTRPSLWIISLFFRRAIDLHLDQMAKDSLENSAEKS